MGEMIERVAKAMENRAEVAGVSIHAAALSDEDWLELARGAMEAIREPTEAMAKAGGNIHSGNDYFSQSDFPKEAAEIYRSMIDAELG